MAGQTRPLAAQAERRAQRRTGQLFSARGWLPYLLVLPALLAIGSIIVYPMLYAMNISLYNVNLLNPDGARYVGLDNYGRILRGAAFWQSLQVTVIYASGSVVLTFLMGLGTALLLNVRFRLRSLARALIVIPWATPWLVTTLIWYVMFNPQIGPVNEVLKRLGVVDTGIPWLYQNNTAMIAIIIVTAWRLFPAATLLLLAGLQSISPELYEAASVDGADQLSRFRFITLPGLRPVIFTVLVLLTIWCSKLYTVAWVLTSGGPGNATRVLSIFTYEEAFKFNRVGTGSTVATLVFFISAILVFIYFRLLRAEAKNETAVVA